IATVQLGAPAKGSDGPAFGVEARPVTGFSPATQISGDSAVGGALHCALERSARVACTHFSKRDVKQPLPTTVTPTIVPGIDDAIQVEVRNQSLTVLTRDGKVLSGRVEGSTPADYALKPVELPEPIVDLALDT